jgi:hypothetical protein
MNCSSLYKNSSKNCEQRHNTSRAVPTCSTLIKYQLTLTPSVVPRFTFVVCAALVFEHTVRTMFRRSPSGGEQHRAYQRSIHRVSNSKRRRSQARRSHSLPRETPAEAEIAGKRVCGCRTVRHYDDGTHHKLGQGTIPCVARCISCKTSGRSRS